MAEPNKRKRSLEDYISDRIQQTVDSAVNVMNTRERPRVYKERVIQPGESMLTEKELNDHINRRIKYMFDDVPFYVSDITYPDGSPYYLGYNPVITSPGYRPNNHHGMPVVSIDKIKKSSDIINNTGVPMYAGEGSTCIFTYTDSYGNTRAIPGNKTWLAKGKSGRHIYEEKGFKLLDPGTPMKKGDMIQLGNSHNDPTHTVMFMDYNKKDTSNHNVVPIISTYTDGGYYEDAMNRNKEYFEYNPDTSNLFRFVGNAADSARWTKEYHSLEKRNGCRKSIKNI